MRREKLQCQKNAFKILIDKNENYMFFFVIDSLNTIENQERSQPVFLVRGGGVFDESLLNSHQK